MVRLSNLEKHIDAELWVRREDLTGLASGGNKTRKLEFLVGDAVQGGYDTIATVGVIQPNHTRQTAAAAARARLKSACSVTIGHWWQGRTIARWPTSS